MVGLIGAPVEITTTSEFENATITFKYDKSRLGDTKEEDLAVMWYDEENGVYQILDNETVLDKEKQTVSYKTTHFSKYMVVDKIYGIIPGEQTLTTEWEQQQNYIMILLLWLILREVWKVSV